MFLIKRTADETQTTTATITVDVKTCLVTGLQFATPPASSVFNVGQDPLLIGFVVTPTPNCGTQTNFSFKVEFPFLSIVTTGLSTGNVKVTNALNRHHQVYNLVLKAFIDNATVETPFTLQIVASQPLVLRTFIGLDMILDFTGKIPETR